MTDHLGLPGRSISHSQLSHPCQLQLKFHRARVPWLNRSISLPYGTSLHAGLEEWALTRDLAQAIKMAERTLNAELLKDPPILWDVKRGPAHRAAIPDFMTAQGMVRKHLTAWHALRKDWPGRILDTETTVFVELTKFDKPWRLQARIDAVVEEDGKKGIWDYKSAGKPWDQKKLEDHMPQAQLYMGAEWYRSRVAPDWFEFAVFVKGTEKIEFHRVPFDAKAINRYLEVVVRPTILTIENESYVPNTETWQHSPQYCSYWHMCPLGAAANPIPIKETQ